MPKNEVPQARLTANTSQKSFWWRDSLHPYQFMPLGLRNANKFFDLLEEKEAQTDKTWTPYANHQFSQDSCGSSRTTARLQAATLVAHTNPTQGSALECLPPSSPVSHSQLSFAMNPVESVSAWTR